MARLQDNAERHEEPACRGAAGAARCTDRADRRHTPAKSRDAPFAVAGIDEVLDRGQLDSDAAGARLRPVPPARQPQRQLSSPHDAVRLARLSLSDQCRSGRRRCSRRRGAHGDRGGDCRKAERKQSVSCPNRSSPPCRPPSGRRRMPAAPPRAPRSARGKHARDPGDAVGVVRRVVVLVALVGRSGPCTGSTSTTRRTCVAVVFGTFQVRSDHVRRDRARVHGRERVVLGAEDPLPARRRSNRRTSGSPASSPAVHDVEVERAKRREPVLRRLRRACAGSPGRVTKPVISALTFTCWNVTGTPCPSFTTTWLPGAGRPKTSQSVLSVVVDQEVAWNTPSPARDRALAPSRRSSSGSGSTMFLVSPGFSASTLKRTWPYPGALATKL